MLSMSIMLAGLGLASSAGDEVSVEYPTPPISYTVSRARCSVFGSNFSERAKTRNLFVFIAFLSFSQIV